MDGSARTQSRSRQGTALRRIAMGAVIPLTVAVGSVPAFAAEQPTESTSTTADSAQQPADQPTTTGTTTTSSTTTPPETAGPGTTSPTDSSATGTRTRSPPPQTQDSSTQPSGGSGTNGAPPVQQQSLAATQPAPQTTAPKSAPPVPDPEGGNAFYTVHVDSSTGRYTITTGPSHPQGNGLNVLYGDGNPGTSFDTVHDFTTGTDHVVGSSGFVPTSVTPLGSPANPTGYRINYAPTSDGLVISEDVNVEGTTFNDSRVVVTLTVANGSTSERVVGVRYLWDYQIGSDDGPTFQAQDPTGPVLTFEDFFAPPGFGYYRIVDNDTNPSPPTFSVLG